MNQNMFVGMGMTREKGAELSESLVELALDLASFNNLQEPDAVNALSKAIMGESEAAKSLGAVLNENTKAAAMEKLGLEGKYDALSETQKMEVNYQAILMQSTDAIGDCARSVDSYKGKQTQLKSAMENVKETIGQMLLPLATLGTSFMVDGVQKVQEFVDVLSDSEKRGEFFSKMLKRLIPEDTIKLIKWWGEHFRDYILDGFKTSAIDTFKSSIENLGKIFEAAGGFIWPVIDVLVQWGSWISTVFVEDVLQGILFPAFDFMMEIFSDIAGMLEKYVKPSFEEIVKIIKWAGEDILLVVDDWILPIFEDFIGIIRELWEENQDKINAIGELFEEVFGTISEIVTWFYDNVLQALLDAIWNMAQYVDDNMGSFKDIMQDAIDFAGEKLQALIDAFVLVRDTIAEVLEEKIFPLFEDFIGMIMNLWKENQDKIGLIRDFFETAFQRIQDIVSIAIKAIKWVFDEILYPVFERVIDFVKDHLDELKDAFQGAIDFVGGIFKFFTSLLKGDWEGCLEGIKDSLSGAWEFVKNIFKIWVDYMASFGDTIWKGVKNAFNKVGKAISQPFEDAGKKIGEIVDKIKGFFSGFKIELPKIKLPHFGIEPEGWKISDLLKGSVPKLGIEWYAKAMDKPFVMDKPTIFGADEEGLNAAGERGREILWGETDMLRTMSSVIAEQNRLSESKLDAIASVLVDLLTELKGKEFATYLDGNELVKRTAERIDEELGRIQRRKERFA